MTLKIPEVLLSNDTLYLSLGHIYQARLRDFAIHVRVSDTLHISQHL